MKYLVFLLVAVISFTSITSIDAQSGTYKKSKSKYAKKIKRKPTLYQQNKKNINMDAFAVKEPEPVVLPEPTPEPVLTLEQPAPAPEPAPVVADEERRSSEFTFLTSLNITMQHIRGTDTFDLPFKLTSKIGFGGSAEVGWNFMKNMGVFINGGIHTLKYAEPVGFVLDADSSAVYNGALGVRIGQDYILGGDIYYGFKQDLHYYNRDNTTGYLSRVSNKLIGAKAAVHIINSQDYGLDFGLGGEYIFKSTRANFEIKSAYVIGTSIDFKIATSDTLYALIGFDFEYRKMAPSTCPYNEYFGMLKLGFGRR
jgi:hypothetical protein